MADYQTTRSFGTAAGAAEIDQGLRAHMNKVYGLMSVGMALTGGVAWAVGTNTRDRARVMAIHAIAKVTSGKRRSATAPRMMMQSSSSAPLVWSGCGDGRSGTSRGE